MWREAVLVMRKELVHLRRDRRTQVLTLLLPIIAMGAFAISFGGQNFQPTADSSPYPLVVQDLDRTPESSQFVSILQTTRLFTLHHLPAGADAREYMKETGAFAAVVIPSGFAQTFGQGNAQLDFIYDNAKPYVGALTISRVKLVMEAIALQQQRGVQVDYTTLVETGSSLDIFTPGIVVLLVSFTSLNDMATSLARERSEGTLGRVFVAPVTKGALLLGKVLAGVLLIILRAVLLLVLAIVAMGFRMHGDPISFLIVVLLVGLVTLGLGILIAARARTDREVMVAALLVTIILMFMMGAITPVDLMTAPARAIATALPHTHATAALRSIMLLGSNVFEVWDKVLILIGSAAVLMFAGVKLFRRAID